jgi:hypothetical protein
MMIGVKFCYEFVMHIRSALLGGLQEKAVRRLRRVQQGARGGGPAEGPLADGAAGSNAEAVLPPRRQVTHLGHRAGAPPSLQPLPALIGHLQPASRQPAGQDCSVPLMLGLLMDQALRGKDIPGMSKHNCTHVRDLIRQQEDSKWGGEWHITTKVTVACETGCLVILASTPDRASPVFNQYYQGKEM